jgi:hypothetical protein
MSLESLGIHTLNIPSPYSNPPIPIVSTGSNHLQTGRLIHIADHYENQSVHISQWSSSLVIKGLLKQFQKNFNVAQAWKEIVRHEPFGDRLLEWSKEDAVLLKRKLEFHKGTPRELAAEARRLAKAPYGVVDHSNWTPSPFSPAHGDVNMSNYI